MQKMPKLFRIEWVVVENEPLENHSFSWIFPKIVICPLNSLLKKNILIWWNHMGKYDSDEYHRNIDFRKFQIYENLRKSVYPWYDTNSCFPIWFHHVQARPRCFFSSKPLYLEITSVVISNIFVNFRKFLNRRWQNVQQFLRWTNCGFVISGWWCKTYLTTSSQLDI